ncbi:MAG: peptide chain release factor N(5)-glutamine methyltransferase [Sedimentisphaerales bacterium]|nr:peptide chain release factor N(5)-glutamine methyltransferase [Sedimentisphaerales bacterium]
MNAGTQATEWTSKRLLDWTSEYLAKAGVEQPRLCAEILLGHVLQRKRIELYTNFDYCPTPEQLTTFRDLVRRCGRHEPVSYLTGKAHFYSLEFAVGPGCLSPRPETETLVEQAIAFCTHEVHRPTVSVLDLCTGSGCVAAAIATNVVEAEVVAVDISPAALNYARRNIEALELAGRVQVIENDLFAGVEASGKAMFDLITANPPYIADAVYDKLPANVKDYEPVEALKAGPDGLDMLRRILAEAESYLADGGALMCEIAFDQGPVVLDLFQDSGYLSECAIVKDDLRHPRVVKGIKK